MKRIVFFDYLRCIAIVAVVTIHVSATIITTGAMNPGFETALVMNTLGRIGVPLFFMISGALFLNPDKIVNGDYLKSDWSLHLLSLRYFIT